MSSDKHNSTSSTIIDFGSCSSVVGKVAPDQTMKVFWIDRLHNRPISQHEHLFGASIKLMPTLYAAGVLFNCNTGQESWNVELIIQFDTIEGRLPFLIGLLCLLAMKENVNFRYCNPSIVIHKGVYGLQLVKRSSHLELPLVLNTTH